MTEPPHRPMLTLDFEGKKYQSSRTPVAMTPYFVCFMDLLGTKSNILRGVDNDFVDGLYCILDICEQIQHDNQRLRIKTFSDNICLFYSIPEGRQCAQEDFVYFLDFVSTFQVMLFMVTAELLRGGIAAGNGYCDNKFVWGEALAKAVNLEHSAENKYPRIAIDKESCEPYMSATAENYLLRNENGLPYLDFFAFAQGDMDAETLQMTQQRLAEKIKRTFRPGNKIDEEILSRVGWFVRFCNLKARQLGRKDLILEASFKTPDGNEISLFAEEISNGQTAKEK